MKWYIIQTTPSYELKVQERLLTRISQSTIPQMFGEVLVPQEEFVEVKNGQKKTGQRRLYPGYVFVEMDFCNESWFLVKKTPNVSGFIGGSETHPQPMPQKEIDKIKKQVDQTHENPIQKVQFSLQEIVQIIDGPFKDFTAAVHEIDYKKGQLKVLVTVFGRETPIEVPFGKVEKVK